MIIDFHTHIGDLRTKPSDPQEPVTWQNLIARLDEEDIDKAVLLPIYASPEAIYPGCILNERISIHDQVLDAASYRERIIPFGNLDPRWMRNDPSGDFNILIDWFLEHGCQGIGEITANIPFDDPRVINMFQQIGNRGLAMVFHGCGFLSGAYGLQDDPGAPRLERLLQEAPMTRMVGHGPGFWAEMAAEVSPQDKMGYPKGPIREEGALPRLMRRYPNLYADISAGSGYNGLTRDPEYGIHFLNEFQDRVIFATDVCFAGAAGHMPHLNYLRQLLVKGHLSQAAFDKITGGNAIKLLKTL